MRAEISFIIVLASCGGTADYPAETVRVNGGAFRMGTAASAIEELRSRYGISFPGSFENETPERLVEITSFRMDRYEITNERFSEFVAAQPEWGPDGPGADTRDGQYLQHWASGTYPEGKGDHPVVFITWQAAQAFCQWAGGRLPTEAEWEYAARAGGVSEFPWGEDLPTPDRANYAASGVGTTIPVGTYPPNPLGLHEMAGNVWEWVLDEWESGGAEERRGIRGGSYGGAVVNLRTRWRDSHVVSNAVAFVGARCVYPANGSTND